MGRRTVAVIVWHVPHFGVVLSDDYKVIWQLHDLLSRLQNYVLPFPVRNFLFDEELHCKEW